MSKITIVNMSLYIMLVLVGVTGCLSDYTDYYAMEQAEDPIVSGPLPEYQCDDGRDNDNDDQIDCDDSDCDFNPACSELVCDNGLDDDDDGYVDCDDFTCFNAPICLSNAENSVGTCTDGADNDGDSEIDCDDLGCAFISICLPEYDCNDGEDNDNDSHVDCEDSDCDLSPECAEKECSDGIDNDGNRLTDCNDPACEYKPECAPELECDDDIDNDGDDYIDCDDQNCRYAKNCQEPTEFSYQACSDGLDNDFDDNIDCADSDCKEYMHCNENTKVTCDDDIDNDLDGFIDCKDEECLAFTICGGNFEGSIIYYNDTTIYVYADTKEEPYISLFDERFDSQGKGPAQWRYNAGDAGSLADTKAESTPYFDENSSDCLDKSGEKSVDEGSCIKVSPSGAGGWGGVFIQFGDYIVGQTFPERDSTVLHDLTAWLYNAIHFEIKGDMDVEVKIQWGEAHIGVRTHESFKLSEYGYTPDGNWHSVVLPVDSKVKDYEYEVLSNPLGFWRSEGSSLSMGTFWLDNIRYKGPSGTGCLLTSDGQIFCP